MHGRRAWLKRIGMVSPTRSRFCEIFRMLNIRRRREDRGQKSSQSFLSRKGNPFERRTPMRIATLIFGGFTALAGRRWRRIPTPRRSTTNRLHRRARPTSRRPTDRGLRCHVRSSAQAGNRRTNPRRERPTKTRTERHALRILVKRVGSRGHDHAEIDAVVGPLSRCPLERRRVPISPDGQISGSAV